MSVPEDKLPHVRALSDVAFNRAQRAVWAICVVVYLTVFIGGIQAGGAELLTVGRAVAFTLGAAVLGRIALGLLGRAMVPAEPVPMAVEDGKVGSLSELLASGNVGEHEDEATAA